MPRHTRTAAAVLLATALLSACTTTENTGSGDGAAGVTDTSVKIAGILAKTSATGYSTGAAEIGAKARFDRANADGGVHGRRIEFTGAEDDGMDPAKGATAAQKLVQKDGVFAVVPVNSPSFGGGSFLEQQGVPWFGWATGPQWCGLRTAFGYNGCLAPEPGAGTQTWWGSQVAAQLGGAEGKRAWIQGTDSTASKTGVSTISQSFTAAGFKIAGTSAAIPATAPPQDWLPYVNKIMKAEGGPPDVVVSIMAGAKLNAGLFGALKKAGYQGAISDATSYDPIVLKDPALKAGLDGVLASPQFEPFESDLPQARQMRDDIVKASGGGAVEFTQHMAVGYWAADVFLAIAEKAGKDLTRESFLKAAESFTYENPGFGRIEYPKDKKEPNGCGALVQLKGAAFEVAQHLRCTPNTPLK
ncbi:ABC transporter substrate-binding protein [Actinocorallia sp. API 0066]|uniref:ABC transporter substrate-binding protein n=1 Tax=Actinocorallia sp. API 0066 TaxID=2896846 RepID=UPI001E53D212|nr:ABC transporter substrate-binding protein [Actinocorallia sp. API 0066]MCD0448487.1 ABC transporter substrate-binding protein [Actinocorallia sp. API 0066]